MMVIRIVTSCILVPTFQRRLPQTNITCHTALPEATLYERSNNLENPLRYQLSSLLPKINIEKANSLFQRFISLAPIFYWTCGSFCIFSYIPTSIWLKPSPFPYRSIPQATKKSAQKKAWLNSMNIWCKYEASLYHWNSVLWNERRWGGWGRGAEVGVGMLKYGK